MVTFVGLPLSQPNEIISGRVRKNITPRSIGHFILCDRFDHPGLEVSTYVGMIRPHILQFVQFVNCGKLDQEPLRRWIRRIRWYMRTCSTQTWELTKEMGKMIMVFCLDYTFRDITQYQWPPALAAFDEEPGASYFETSPFWPFWPSASNLQDFEKVKVLFGTTKWTLCFNWISIW